MKLIRLGLLTVTALLVLRCSGSNSSGTDTPIPPGVTTFNVSTSSLYDINGSNNPTLTLVRGTTYTFNISTAGHPFYISTVSGSTAGANAYVGNGYTGASKTTGSIVFTPDVTTPNTLFYDCTIHSFMTGTINVTN